MLTLLIEEGSKTLIENNQLVGSGSGMPRLPTPLIVDSLVQRGIQTQITLC